MTIRRPHFHCFSIACLSLGFLLSPQHATAQKAALPEGVRVVRGLEYARRDGVPLLLDLYLPQKMPAQPLPVVVWVHGGGWLKGSRANPKNATWLAGRGFAVASIDYRLTDAAVWPAQIDDCRDAVRWLRSHAAAHGLDAEHIGAFGASAGGHLAALMGTRPYADGEDDTSRIQAVCDWFGPSELLTMPPNVVGNGRTEQQVAASNGAKLLGAPVRDVPERARDASPLDQASSDDAPFLIMHGSEDPMVPVAQSEKLHAKLRATGVPSEFHLVKGAGHGGALFATPDVRSKVEAFFNRTLRPIPKK